MKERETKTTTQQRVFFTADCARLSARKTKPAE
jgi:hypothetical protein